MGEGLVKREETFVSDEQASVVAQMSKGALDFPASAIAPQGPAILQDASPTSPVRTDQLDATRGESPAQPLAW